MHKKLKKILIFISFLIDSFLNFAYIKELKKKLLNFMLKNLRFLIGIFEFYFLIFKFEYIQMEKVSLLEILSISILKRRDLKHFY